MDLKLVYKSHSIGAAIKRNIANGVLTQRNARWRSRVSIHPTQYHEAQSLFVAFGMRVFGQRGQRVQASKQLAEKLEFVLC
jgi:hypothetical protein